MMSQHDLEVIRLNEILLEIAKLEAVDQGDLEASFEKISKAVAFALSIERVSIWFYNDQQTAITCSKLYEVKSKKFSEGHELKAEDFPEYFKYLSEERALLADDVRTNPVTIEFLESYLEPLNIFSMLDAPIRVNGKMIGVICSEKTDKPRSWRQKDALFVGNIADILARAIQAQERRLALEELQKNNDNLEKLVLKRTAELETQRASSLFASKMSALGEMAGGVAHEINTPLATIRMRLEQMEKSMIESSIDKIDAIDFLEGIEDVKMTVDRIAKIVSGLRFFAREGKATDLEFIEVSTLIEETLSFCGERFRSHGLNLEVLKDEVYKSIKIECRPVEISQVLLNLLNNSYDAVKNLEKKWIRIEVSDKGQNIEVSITDSGTGIPKDIQEKLMQPFFTTKEVGSGTGLGLSISNGILVSHQGKIFVDNNCPNTKFTIVLPKIQI